MENLRIPNWLKQTIKYGHPILWDICFVYFQSPENNFAIMIKTILQNIPALIIITILGYVITFYYHKIDKIQKQYKKDKLLQQLSEKTVLIYLGLILRFIRNLSNEDLKNYGYSDTTQTELKFIGHSENKETSKDEIKNQSRVDIIEIEKLKKNFSDAELEKLGFTEDIIKYIRNKCR